MKKYGFNDDKAFDFFNHLFLIVLLFVMLYPFWFVIITSFSDMRRLSFEGNPGFLPKGLSLFGYKELLLYKLLPRYFANTLIYLSIGTLLKLTVASLAGFVLSVKRFKPGKFVMIAMVLTMFFGGGLIPTFMLIRSLGGFDTIWVMVVPGCLDVYMCIVFKTFFQQLPGELKDAAEIDGANDLVMLFRIVLPVSKPLLATFGIFSIVGYWNEWFSALLYLRKNEMHPIQMFLRRLIVQMETLQSGTGVVMVNQMETLGRARVVRAAAIVVSTLPIMLIYPFFQKYFTKGIIVGSLKG